MGHEGSGTGGERDTAVRERRNHMGGGILIVDCTAAPAREPLHCLGPLALWTGLRNAGHDDSGLVEVSAVESLQELHRSGTEWHQTLASVLSDREPRMVLFYTTCGNYLDVLETARRLREFLPDTPIALGGPQAASTAAATLEAFAFVDAVYAGEADLTVSDVVAFLDGELKGESVPGLFFRQGISVLSPCVPATPPDLDETPWPDYGLVGGPYPGTPVSLDVGRGCPYSCRFCTTGGFFRHRFRLRSPESIVAEVVRMHTTYGCDTFKFEHDLFTRDRERVLEVCRLLGEADLGLRWECSARVDTLDSELVAAMAAAGCYSILLGVESGSPRIQASSHKGLDTGTILPTVKMLMDVGIAPGVSLIYGFPEEEEEDLEQTMGLVADCYDMGCWHVFLHRLTYLPGTPYTAEEAENLVLDDGRGFVDIASGALPAWAHRTVEDHPDIFPYYYTRATPVTERYGSLSLFYAVLYMPVYLWFRSCFAVLRGYYGRDILALYRDLDVRQPGFLERLVPDWEDDAEGDLGEYVGRLARLLGDFAAGDPTLGGAMETALAKDRESLADKPVFPEWDCPDQAK